MAIIKLTPSCKDYLWGGSRLRTDFGVQSDLDPLAEAWHALSVELDGRRHWQRRIPSSNPGQTDSLDYHCRVEVPAGAPLRIRALAQAHGARRLQLRIDAEEG